MKYYLLTLLLVVGAISFITVTPHLSVIAESSLVAAQVPQNNTAVAGVQKVVLPPISQGLPLPALSGHAVLVKDLDTNTILYQKEVNVAIPIASTTKIMTALVGSEFFKSNSVLLVTEKAKVGGAQVGFNIGETLSFRSVLYGMLLNSGNDAAFTIAENYPGGTLGFVSAMNKKAEDLNLRNTHFENPAGFDSPQHFSSAADLAIISEQALKDPLLARIFATKETQILSLDKKYTHDLYNLNKLLSSVPGVLGIKTGYTELAKENLVTLVDRDNHKVLTVVLGSDDRFGDSTKLIEWAFQNYIWQGSMNN